MPQKQDEQCIESILEKIANNITVSNDFSSRVENMHSTQVRQDMRLLALEEAQRESKESRTYIRNRLDELSAYLNEFKGDVKIEMNGIVLKITFIMSGLSFFFSIIAALIIKKF